MENFLNQGEAKAADMSGVPLNRLEALAELYADPKTKVVSFWTMGFKTCIDCHKGIAHHLPDMRGISGWQ